MSPSFNETWTLSQELIAPLGSAMVMLVLAWAYLNHIRMP